MGRQTIAMGLLPSFKAILRNLPKIIDRIEALRSRGRHKRRRREEEFLDLIRRRRENG